MSDVPGVNEVLIIPLVNKAEIKYLKYYRVPSKSIKLFYWAIKVRG